MSHLFGMPVQVTQDPLRYGPLPKDVAVSPAFRAEFDAWCERFFSRVPEMNPAQDGQVFTRMGSDVLVMNPRTFELLRKSVKA